MKFLKNLFVSRRLFDLTRQIEDARKNGNSYVALSIMDEGLRPRHRNT